MKNRLSFVTLGLLGILAATPSCGADEGTDGDDGAGGSSGSDGTCVDRGGPEEDDRQCREGRLCVDTDGNRDDYCDPGETCNCVGVGEGGTGGSTGGAGGKGGTAGATLGGTGGTGTGGTGTGGTGGSVTSALGEPCVEDVDCGGSPLVCLLPNGLPSGDGMPNGLCTLPCQMTDECLEFADAAYCVGLEETEAGEVLNYCLLACDPGPSASPKCRLRDDFACSILDTQPTATACTETAMCGFGQVCFEGVCQDMITACLPVCRADSDCGEGFCSFASGFCMAEEPTGLPIGALCDPNLPPEEDECDGLCLATDDTSTEGTCAAFCSAGPNIYGCGWVGEGLPDAGCLFATIISRDTTGNPTLSQSDLMLCGGLCDCNDDCPATTDRCMDENAANATASIQALFGRAGYCRPLIDTRNETEADTISECPMSSQ